MHGKVFARVTNNSPQTVFIEDLEASNIHFVNKKTGKLHVLVHSCACGGACYPKRKIGRRIVQLKPGETKKFSYDDFGCGGGLWPAPPKGRYRVYFAMRVFSAQGPLPAPWCRKGKEGRLDIRETITSCRETLHSKSFWKGAVASPAQPLDLRRTKTKWVR